jgi:hypothetical protein
MPENRKTKRRSPQNMLRLPDLDHSKASAFTKPWFDCFETNLCLRHKRLHHPVLVRTQTGVRAHCRTQIPWNWRQGGLPLQPVDKLMAHRPQVCRRCVNFSARSKA